MSKRSPTNVKLLYKVAEKITRYLAEEEPDLQYDIRTVYEEDEIWLELKLYTNSLEYITLQRLNELAEEEDIYMTFVFLKYDEVANKMYFLLFFE